MKIPKVETLVIFAFFGIVALWAVSKCNSKRSDYARRAKDYTEEADERPAKKDTVRAPVTPAPQPQTQPVAQAPVTPPPALTQPANTAPAATTTAPAAHPGRAPQHPSNTPPPAATQPISPGSQSAAPAASGSKYATLYVTIDGLKVRKEPSLKGAMVTKLDLYQQVYFLNQKSEKTETISLGTEKATDHWVKIRTKEGKEGWVFGAGVHYYKTKRKGTFE
jgi:hypothetical protein